MEEGEEGDGLQVLQEDSKFSRWAEQEDFTRLEEARVSKGLGKEGSGLCLEQLGFEMFVRKSFRQSKLCVLKL